MVNPRIEPLVAGVVSPEGLDLDWELGHPQDQQRRQAEGDPRDIYECSLAAYLTQSAEGTAPGRALAVFFTRAVFHLKFLCVREESGIDGLGDLAGRRVGMPDYLMSAGFWFRIMLRELYGIDPADVQWFNGRPHRRQRAALGIGSAAAVPVGTIPEGTTLMEGLAADRLDAAFGGDPGDLVRAGVGIRPLLDDEQIVDLVLDLYRKTGATPVNHTVGIRHDVLAADPTIVGILADAFARSKQEAYRRDPAAAYPLVEATDPARQLAVLGPDPFPFGVEANRASLELLADELVAEHQLVVRPDLDRLFLEPS